MLLKIPRECEARSPTFKGTNSTRKAERISLKFQTLHIVEKVQSLLPSPCLFQVPQLLNLRSLGWKQTEALPNASRIWNDKHWTIYDKLLLLFAEKLGWPTANGRSSDSLSTFPRANMVSPKPMDQAMHTGSVYSTRVMATQFAKLSGWWL